eukprot:TRINITY_DN3856_c1_g1_i2.p1 TRINITY_DN3856_c1_g1~~TRINITY_DN3856_c1_g1_i2.p1  ORF type:complete len:189 (+),score=26.46 TRINITY_DN3856_c1_g1_i2:54-620(+)
MSKPDRYKSRKIPIAVIKGLKKHIHGDLVRDVVEYANIPQLQHEYVLRSNFSDELTLYKKEVAAAKEDLNTFVDDEWMPDIEKTLRHSNRHRWESSFHTKHPGKLKNAFDVIFRYKIAHSQEYAKRREWESKYLRRLLCQRHSVRISSCIFSRYLGEHNKSFVYNIEVPNPMASSHLTQLLRCSEIEK